MNKNLQATQFTVLYLHGFLSSPQSVKAQQTLHFLEKRGFADRILIPELGHEPKKTVTILRNLLKRDRTQPLALIGSSLGGYYATYLAEEYNLPAVLINPAVRPFEHWERHIGDHKNYYTDEIHTVRESHIIELENLHKPSLQYPDNFMVLVQEGDDVLDYRDAVDKFNASTCLVTKNGSHAFENYAEELPRIYEFLLSRIDRFVR